MQVAIGVAAAEYLRLVWKTGRFVTEPPDIYERVARDYPVILAMWHGQHYLAPFLKLREHRAKVLISKHRDGEVNAIAAQRLGVEAIRGSGHQGTDFIGKGGVGAFKEMVSALQEGCIVALSADVPMVSRVAGLGIVKLASASGRPIYPVALATHRRIEFDTWDRTSISLPFSRGAGVVAEPIWVPPEADAEALESARSTLQASLDRVTTRAYHLADRD
jgi:lysophospholipid acyltransferase (LPLAT)-like uncharacterized protein